MEQFSRLLLLTLLHSLWQSAIIALFLFAFKKWIPDVHPASLRKLMVLGLFSQFFLSTATFLLLYFQPETFWQTEIPGSGLELYPGLMQLLAIGYLTIVCLLFIRTIRLWYLFKVSVKRGTQKAPFHLRLFTKNTALHLGIKRKVMLLLSDHITVPVTFGMLKPVILLPVALINQLSIEETESIILHELQHIRVKDYLVNWVCIISKNLFFFNPAIYYIVKEIKQSREMNCDAVVLDYRYPVFSYASALLKTAKLDLSSRHFSLPATGNYSEQLKHRVAFMRDRYPSIKKKNILPAFIPAFMLTGLMMLMILSKPDFPSVGAFSVSNGYLNAASTEPINAEVPVVTIAEPPLPEPTPALTSVAKKNQSKASRTPVSQKSPEVSSLLNTEAANGFELIPVSDILVPEPKEITVREENSESGIILTSHYLLVQNKDGYQLKLLWKLAEAQVPDSLRNQHGDSSIIYFPERKAEQ